VTTLLDTASRAAARALTNERGEFQLSAARAGTYRIRTVRIGYRPFLSDPTRLAAGQTSTPRLKLTDIPFVLDAIRTEGTSTCRMSARDSAAATWAVWEQVRAALNAGDLTARSEGIGTTIVSYRRTLDLANGRITQQTATVRSEVLKQPWRSISADSLRKTGYVFETGDYTNYLAPSLDVLMSDAFLDDHCLRLVTADPGKVGVVFEPTSERKGIPEIRGTVWLDRSTAELRTLDFRYANVQKDVEDNAGGDMQFIRMRNGAWAISRWNIRMPVIAQIVVPGRPFETQVSHIEVTGGELVLATVAVAHGRDTIWSRPPLIATGTIEDSVSGDAVRNARVELRGTSTEATTDPRGYFSLADVMPGNYVLLIHTASLDSVNAIKELPLVLTDSMPALTIRVPTGRQISDHLCGRQLPTLQGIVTGTVSLRSASTPSAGVVVEAAWTDVSVTHGIESVRRVANARSGTEGRFTICGLPVNTALDLSATGDKASAAPVTIRIPAAERFGRADLTLDADGTAAVFTGVVLEDSTHAPVANAEVSLPAASLTVFTNEKGTFRIADIAPGQQNVRIRRLGYGVLDTLLEFVAGRALRRTVYLSRVTVLDSVLTTGLTTRDFGMESFEENRRLGLGKFYTREDIAKFDGGHVSDVLAQSAGIQIIPGHAGQAWIVSSRGVRSFGGDSVTTVDRSNGARDALCYPQVYLDNTLVYASGHTGIPAPLFDVNSISPASIEAIEYYAGAARIPAIYMRLDSPCGVLVIHTRR
jgi:hypothetical protein